jgi:DNA-binding response OmpR family regulator
LRGVLPFFSDVLEFEMARSAWRVLLVDDDEDDYFLTREMLAQAQGRKILLDWASDYETAQKKIDTETFDAVLVDYSLGAVRA